MAQRLFPLMIIGLLATSAAAQERQWMLDASGEDAYLVFGVPESDDVGISLWCPVQGGEVNIYLPSAPKGITSGQQIMVTVSTDETSFDLMGRAQSADDGTGSSIEVTIPTDHPLLGALIEADRFRLKVAGEETVFPAYEADFAGLMALCRKP